MFENQGFSGGRESEEKCQILTVWVNGPVSWTGEMCVGDSCDRGNLTAFSRDEASFTGLRLIVFKPSAPDPRLMALIVVGSVLGLMLIVFMVALASKFGLRLIVLIVFTSIMFVSMLTVLIELLSREFGLRLTVLNPVLLMGC